MRHSLPIHFAVYFLIHSLLRITENCVCFLRNVWWWNLVLCRVSGFFGRILAMVLSIYCITAAKFVFIFVEISALNDETHLNHRSHKFQLTWSASKFSFVRSYTQARTHTHIQIQLKENMLSKTLLQMRGNTDCTL